jgi:hypothetical protein
MWQYKCLYIFLLHSWHNKSLRLRVASMSPRGIACLAWRIFEPRHRSICWISAAAYCVHLHMARKKHRHPPRIHHSLTCYRHICSPYVALKNHILFLPCNASSNIILLVASTNNLSIFHQYLTCLRQSFLVRLSSQIGFMSQCPTFAQRAPLRYIRYATVNEVMAAPARTILPTILTPYPPIAAL